MKAIPIIVTDSGDLCETKGSGSEAYKIKKREAACTLARHGADVDISWYVAVSKAPELPAVVQAELHLLDIYLDIVEEVKKLPSLRHNVHSVSYSLNVRIGNCVTDEQLCKELTKQLSDDSLRLDCKPDLIVCQPNYLNQVQRAAATQGLETKVLMAID